MAGAYVRLDINDQQWQRAKRAIEQLLRDPEPMLIDIGEHLQLSTDERFDQRVTPEGVPWAPVSSGYAQAKRTGEATQRSGAVRDPNQILQLTRDMRRLTRYQVSATDLQFGSDREYAATHQFGDPRRNIPARKWLGLSAEDREAVEEIAAEHLQLAVTR